MSVIPVPINCLPKPMFLTNRIPGILPVPIFVEFVRKFCWMSFLRQPRQKINSRDFPWGAKAIQIADGRVSNYFLTTFGRAKRETVCSCEVVMEPSLSQALHLLNGDTTNKRIAQGKVISNRLKEGMKPHKIIEELYLRCFSREPRAAEKENLLASLDLENPDEGLEDIL